MIVQKIGRHQNALTRYRTLQVVTCSVIEQMAMGSSYRQQAVVDILHGKVTAGQLNITNITFSFSAETF